MSSLPVRGLPEFDFLLGSEFFAGPLTVVAGQALEMTRQVTYSTAASSQRVSSLSDFSRRMRMG
jgi:hypothetical protein